jgi:CelD/BcsL family acetyltransferase involved in cellulose biosynthesis
MTTRSAPLTLDVLNAEEARRRLDLRTAWERLETANQGLYALYQSPTWWDHLLATQGPQGLHLGVVARGDDALSAVIPLESRKHSLPFDVGRRSLGGVRFSVVSAVGVDCLLVERAAEARQLLGSIVASFPQYDGVYVKSMDVDAPLWADIADHPNGDDWFAYVADGVRPLYSIALPASFDEYLQKFSGKTRNTLSRKVKALRKEAVGSLTLVRVGAESDVDDFLAGVREIERHSWKRGGAGWRCARSRDGCARLKDAASRGLLRAYLLKAGDVPCAFVNGYQYGGVYHYADLAYDERYSRLSPGLVLLFLLIEDLFLCNQPMRLNFGIGYADYKQQFANEIMRDASLLILRRSLANRLRVGLHSGFRGLKRLVRRGFRRNNGPGVAPSAPQPCEPARGSRDERVGREPGTTVPEMVSHDGP